MSVSHHAWETHRNLPTDFDGSLAKISVRTSVGSAGAPMSPSFIVGSEDPSIWLAFAEMSLPALGAEAAHWIEFHEMEN